MHLNLFCKLFYLIRLYFSDIGVECLYVEFDLLLITALSISLEHLLVEFSEVIYFNQAPEISVF